MPRVVIATGGNQESTGVAIENALDALRGHAEIQVIQTSNLYRTEPMGAAAGEGFLNGATLIETSLEPLALLDLLQQIESDNHRTRETHWGPRTLDLDIVFYADQIITSERLTVPHPHCWYRRFVLEPVSELCPDWPHSVIGLSVLELRDRLYANPFNVTVAGDVDVDALSDAFRTEFPHARFQHVPGPVGPPVTGLGIFVAVERRKLPALWLHAHPDTWLQTARDVLTAACGHCLPRLT